MKLLTYCFCYLLTAFVFLLPSCSRKDIGTERIPEATELDGTLGISEVRQLDINQFRLAYLFDSVKGMNLSSYGIIVEPRQTDLSRQIIILGTGAISQNRGTVILDSLPAESSYWVSLFVNRGTDTIFSKKRAVQPDSFSITSINTDGSGVNSPSSAVRLQTNFRTADPTRQFTISIDGKACEVRRQWDNWVEFDVPAMLASGDKKLILNCKGMQAEGIIRILYGRWEALPDYYIPPFINGTNPNHISAYGIARLGSKGYVIGGQYHYPISQPTYNVGSGFNNLLWEYDQVQNKWSYITTKTGMCFNNPRVETVDNRIFVLNGTMRSFDIDSHAIRTIKNVYEFDFAKKDWIARAAIPEEISSTQWYSFVHSGKIYVGTGRTSIMYWPDGSSGYETKNYDGKLWYYNPASDSWTKLNDFPGDKRIGPGSFVIGNKAYMFGGSFGYNHHTNELWEYDIPADRWTMIDVEGERPLPGVYSRCFTHNGKGYILSNWERREGLGGYDFGVYKNWQYDPVTKKFTEIVSPGSGFPGRRVDVSGGVISSVGNDFILLGMGVTGVGGTETEQVNKLTLN